MLLWYKKTDLRLTRTLFCVCAYGWSIMKSHPPAPAGLQNALLSGCAVIIPAVAITGFGCCRRHYSFNFNVSGMSDVQTMSDEERELAEVIVSALNLEMQAAEIDPQAPLYGEGLGLDSIDILEIALAVSKRYGVQIRSDDNDNVRIFSSLRSLNEHVQQQRAA